ncbi:uncharacterized protein LOC130353761 isoform X2 [Hyla sarda]|uniref:uncharacterized protein LOC130353761 isoform X2 n=1 Tax=Hyla sarda TaxID=327740 RepID=UPI0024C3F343|nr:uncharacterized protein LOC130353761 isoform X2 [Hyla sarda]
MSSALWVHYKTQKGRSDNGILENMALGKMNITQEPTLNTTEGNISRISCHWNSEDDEQVRVQWRKYISSTEDENGAALCSVRTEQSNYSEVRNNKITCNVANNTAQLTIEGVKEDDGGLYVCEVIIEIPRLNKAKGSGTRLNVQQKNEGPPLKSKAPYSAIVVIFPILMALTAYFLCKRKKKKFKKIPQKRRQQHVELHQIHQDAAKAEEDSNSSDSVTWALSTLYESFDYFAIRKPGDNTAAISTSNLARPETVEESSLTAM